MPLLSDLVIQKIESSPSLEAAAEFFGVGEWTVSRWKDRTEPIPLSAVEMVFDPKQIAVPEEALWEGKKVAILLPWYKTVCPLTSFSLMSMLDRTKMAVMMNYGDAFIVHARNTLARKFLSSNLEWALTLDDDMVIPCGNAAWFNANTGFELPDFFAGLHAFNRLVSHGKTLVGALYFGRWKHGQAVYAEGPSEEAYLRRGPHNVCKPTKWVGTGCMLIHRTVFTDIEKTFPHLARDAQGNHGHWFTSSEHDLREASRQALDILGDESASAEARVVKANDILKDAQHRAKFHSGLGMGEDVQFCIRAAQAGHQPHVDLGLICGHQGAFIYGHKKAGWTR